MGSSNVCIISDETMICSNPKDNERVGNKVGNDGKESRPTSDMTSFLMLFFGSVGGIKAVDESLELSFS